MCCFAQLRSDTYDEVAHAGGEEMEWEEEEDRLLPASDLRQPAKSLAKDPAGVADERRAKRSRILPLGTRRCFLVLTAAPHRERLPLPDVGLQGNLCCDEASLAQRLDESHVLAWGCVGRLEASAGSVGTRMAPKTPSTRQAIAEFRVFQFGTMWLKRCSLRDDGLLCREVRIIRLSHKSNGGELAVVTVVPAFSCSPGSVMQFKTLAPTQIALQPGAGESMVIRLFPDDA